MNKEVREISRSFVAPRRVFPLSVWRGFTHILIHKYLHLSTCLKQHTESKNRICPFQVPIQMGHPEQMLMQSTAMNASSKNIIALLSDSNSAPPCEQRTSSVIGDIPGVPQQHVNNMCQRNVLCLQPARSLEDEGYLFKFGNNGSF